MKTKSPTGKEADIDWEEIEEHADIMDRAHKAAKADEIVGSILENKSLSILDTLDNEMISKVFWSMHHSVKNAGYNHYIDNRKATVSLQETNINFKKIEIGIQENKNSKEDIEVLKKEIERINILINENEKAKIQLDYLRSLRKEIAKVIIIKNIPMGDYEEFVERIAIEKLD